MESFDLAERMADERARTLGMPIATKAAVDFARPEAKKYLEVIDGFGFELTDFSILSPRPYQDYVVMLVRRKKILNDIGPLAVNPYFLRTMQSEFDKNTSLPVMELSITEIATYYIISFYSES